MRGLKPTKKEVQLEAALTRHLADQVVRASDRLSGAVSRNPAIARRVARLRREAGVARLEAATSAVVSRPRLRRRLMAYAERATKLAADSDHAGLVTFDEAKQLIGALNDAFAALQLFT